MTVEQAKEFLNRTMTVVGKKEAIEEGNSDFLRRYSTVTGSAQAIQVIVEESTRNPNTLFYLDDGETIELDLEEITSDITSQYKDNLIKVVVGTNCTSIGDNAFSEFSYLKEIKLHNGITYIGEKAFYFCASLGGNYTPNMTIDDLITIPSSVETIGENAFNGVLIINVENASPEVFNKQIFGCPFTPFATGTIRCIINIKHVDESVPAGDYVELLSMVIPTLAHGNEKYVFEYYIITDLIPEMDYVIDERTIIHSVTMQSLFNLVDADNNGQVSAEEIVYFLMGDVHPKADEDDSYTSFYINVVDEYENYSGHSVRSDRTFAEQGFIHLYTVDHCEIDETPDQYDISSSYPNSDEVTYYSYCVDSGYYYNEGQTTAGNDGEFEYYMSSSNPYNDGVNNEISLMRDYWQQGYNAQWLIEHPDTNIEYWEGYHAGITDDGEGSSQNPYIYDIEKYEWWNDGYQAGWDLNGNNHHVDDPGEDTEV